SEDSHYKKTAKILREKIVGISSEYRYSDDIPTKQVVGNNSSEFLLSSEIPRNFPTEFRGNKFPRKFRGPLFCRKCPGNIPRENFVGIFPRTFIDRCVLDIYTSIDRNIPTELFPRIIPRDIFLGIFRGTRSSEYSEGTVPRYILRNMSLVGEVEGYTVEVVTIFVGNLEKECPKTSKFKMFFDKLRGFAKILGGRKKEEKETTTLTVEQLKEIKDGILKWQTVIVKVANTMVVSTTTNNEGSAGSNPGAGTPSTDTNNQSQGAPSTDTNNQSQGTTEGSSSPNSGSATGSPSNKPSAGSNPGAGTPSTDTNNQSQGTTNTASSRSATTSQTTEVTVTEVETQTSEQVMTFLMNLEKKCPPKEEYKQFFEKLKSTMAGSAKVSSPKKKGGLFAMIKGAVGK
ncbi:hypothetical protein F2Q70_00012784, partial [Brassica cretica]